MGASQQPTSEETPATSDIWAFFLPPLALRLARVLPLTECLSGGHMFRSGDRRLPILLLAGLCVGGCTSPAEHARPGEAISTPGIARDAGGGDSRQLGPGGGGGAGGGDSIGGRGDQGGGLGDQGGLVPDGEAAVSEPAAFIEAHTAMLREVGQRCGAGSQQLVSSLVRQKVVANEIAAGRLELNPDAVPACLAALRAADCEEIVSSAGGNANTVVLSDLDAIGACALVFVGRVPVGGACSPGASKVFAQECAQGYCHAEQTCPGRCLAYRKLGESCDANMGRCESGLFCRGSCQLKAQRGQVCQAEAQCADGLTCVESVCDQPQGLGGSCRNDNNCIDGLICVDQTCREPLPVDARCFGSHQCASGLCIQLRCMATELPVGAACSASVSCKSGYCREQACVPTAGLGEACQVGQAPWCRAPAGSALFCRNGTCAAPAAVGESCEEDYHCANGRLCLDARCVEHAPIGGRCRRRTDCGDGADCVAEQGQEDRFVCRPLLDLGAACSYAWGCASGICRNEICAAPAAIGEPCPEDVKNSCVPEAYCEHTPSRTCRLRFAAGRECNPNADQCAQDLYCDRQDEVCRRRPGLGQACDYYPTGDECETGSYCDRESDTCVAPLPLGAPCAGGDRCAEGRCYGFSVDPKRCTPSGTFASTC